MKKNNKINNDLSKFLSSEEGKVVKGDVVKMALALGLVGVSVQESMAGHSNTANSSFHNNSNYGAYHFSGRHNSHSSHGSHGSHASW